MTMMPPMNGMAMQSSPMSPPHMGQGLAPQGMMMMQPGGHQAAGMGMGGMPMMGQGQGLAPQGMTMMHNPNGGNMMQAGGMYQQQQQPGMGMNMNMQPQQPGMMQPGMMQQGMMQQGMPMGGYPNNNNNNMPNYGAPPLPPNTFPSF